MSDSNRTKMGPGGQSSDSQPPEGLSTPSPTPVPASPPGPGFATSYLPNQGDPLIGATLAGRYAISKKLGEGGMGAVYLATHTLLDKQVALKVLHNEFSRKPDLVERFMQEAKSASRIRHENVIDISDFGSTPEGLVFFAMELLKGHDLHEEIARARLNGQLLPWARSKRIFLQICEALRAAHGHGIVHRDLKPENVYLVDFLGEPDFVKLLDFGIAKLTEVDEGGRKLTKTGMLFGTPEYMSPEQARGEQVDHRVDVYAMGCILFQLVTGRVPFEAENFMGVLTLHLTEPPPQIPIEVFDSIGAPRELGEVINRALEKDRNARWSTIEELSNAVRRVCGDQLTAGQTNAHTAQHAMVKAPESTTMPAQRGTAPITAQRAATGSTPVPAAAAGRNRTEWTGQVKVPASETEFTEGREPRKSKLPLILGAAVVLIGGAAAAFMLFDRSAPPPPPAPVIATPGSAQAPVVTPDAAVVATPPELPPLTGKVEVKIETVPAGAQIFDLKDNKLGKTPFTDRPFASRDEVRYRVSLKGYGDQMIVIVPDRDQKETLTLEKGVAGGEPKKIVVGKKPDKPTDATVKPVEVKPTENPTEVPVVKPPDDKPVDKPPEVKPVEKQPTEEECAEDPGKPLCLKKVDFSKPGGQ